MDLMYLLMPIIISITVIVPFIAFKMIYETAKKRVEGQCYIKDMAILTFVCAFYTFFILLFYF